MIICCHDLVGVDSKTLVSYLLIYFDLFNLYFHLFAKKPKTKPFSELG
jgi:hypothetical protein